MALKIFEKQQVVIATIVVAMAGVFTVLQYLPTVRKAKAYDAENLQLIGENAKTLSKLNELPQIYEQVKKLNKDIGNFDLKIPQARSHGPFLQRIADVMHEHDLTELLVQPGSEINENDIICIPININCKGRIGQIFGFLRSLENFERIIQTEEVCFKNGDNYDGLLYMQMKANIFYRTK